MRVNKSMRVFLGEVWIELAPARCPGAARLPYLSHSCREWWELQGEARRGLGCHQPKLRLSLFLISPDLSHPTDMRLQRKRGPITRPLPSYSRGTSRKTMKVPTSTDSVVQVRASGRAQNCLLT